MNQKTISVANKPTAPETNRMPKPGGRTVFDIVRDHVLTYFNLLSLVLFVLVCFTGSYRNTLFIGVVLCNAVIGICQELYLKHQLDKLKTVRQQRYTVLREDKTITLLSEEITNGDILFLTAGEEIPCDLEILSTDYLEVNEALLTGESEPVRKQPGDILSGGSFVVSGDCHAKAIRVGMQTDYARMMVSAGKYKRSPSLILEGIEKIIKGMSLVILPLGILLFLSTHFRGDGDWRAAVVTTAAGIIGMIPSGLYLITTITSTTAVLKLARKSAVVNDFTGVEALSRVTTICLDKTGTLTTGEIKVTELIPYEENCEELLRLFSKTFPVRNPTLEGIYCAYGDETCLVAEDVIPFSSDRKYSQIMLNGVCYCLGAADRLVSDVKILEMVNTRMKEGKRVLALTEDDRCLALLVMEDMIKQEAKAVLHYF
ncbi:MAG: HAD-IC family P-type ATPase, partial [Clostridia bacterium]|nr:HAD-IC family P-type ATPase [Clostridia bacterium]